MQPGPSSTRLPSLPRPASLLFAVALLVLVSGPRAGFAKAPPSKPSVTELVSHLAKCKSIATCQAIRTLVARGASIWPEIEAGLKAPDEMTRFWTLGVLSELTIEAAQQAIAARLDDKLVRVRAAAAFALGAYRSPKVVVWLLKALKDADLNVRFEAADALGSIKDSRSIEPLIAALRDPEPYVRGGVAEALGKIGSRKATPRLIERINEDINADVRGRATIALMKLKDPRAVAPLIARLNAEHEKKALCATAAALGELGDHRAIVPLKQALVRHKNDKDVLKYVDYALTQLEPKTKPGDSKQPGK